MKTILLAICALGAIACFLALPFLVMVEAPLEYGLFFNQKIVYYHAPAAIMMFGTAICTGLASVMYLWRRKPEWDDLAAASGDMTVLLGAVVLTTGPIWGKIAWGTYWVWDARLTQSLLLWMIFVAYALVRRYGGPSSHRLAGLRLCGSVTEPFASRGGRRR